MSFLYPFADLSTPKTGGQVYDSKLMFYLSRNGADIEILNETTFNITASDSVIKLPMKMLQKLRILMRNKTLIFNTAFFPYYIIPFFILKIFSPNTKLYGIHHHFRFQEQTGLKKKIYKYLEFINLKQCDGVICPCPYTKNVIKSHSNNIKTIDIENSFEADIKPLSIFLKKRLLFVGSVYERKGIDYLIQAINLLPNPDKENLKVDIIGNLNSENYVAGLKDLVKKFNLQKIITFKGRVSDLTEYYGSAYTFVLPSLLEGYGLVIIEAMKYGLPVIAFNNSAIPYTIKDGYNGLLAENKNAHSLSSKLHLLLNNEELHSKLVLGALETAKKARTDQEFEQDVKQFISVLRDQ